MPSLTELPDPFPQLRDPISSLALTPFQGLLSPPPACCAPGPVLLESSSPYVLLLPSWAPFTLSSISLVSLEVCLLPLRSSSFCPPPPPAPCSFPGPRPVSSHLPSSGQLHLGSLALALWWYLEEEELEWRPSLSVLTLASADHSHGAAQFPPAAGSCLSVSPAEVQAVHQCVCGSGRAAAWDGIENSG